MSGLPREEPSDQQHSSSSAIDATNLIRNQPPTKVLMKKPLTIDTESLELKENEKVQLYRHQVAGHYPIFWKSGVICKPIQKNELEFYQYISEHLKDIIPFVPRYLGVVTMNYGDLPPTPTEIKTKGSAMAEFPEQSSQTAEFNRFSKWGLRCHQKKKSALKRPVVKYIKLEDLTMPFSRPNILDLKIGSRVYGVGDDPDKVKRKIQKSAKTTSKSLGLRLCGMQVRKSFVSYCSLFFRCGELQCDNVSVPRSTTRTMMSTSSGTSSTAAC